MPANLSLEGNFFELAKDLFISDVKVSAEHSDEIFKIFDGIVLKRLAFLLLNIINFFWYFCLCYFIKTK